MKHSDRWAWSSKDGKKHLPKDSFQLPSVEWIWEGDWYIDHGIDGDNEVTEILAVRLKLICDLTNCFITCKSWCHPLMQ